MSDSVRPHRWQPTRLPRPWDSPGKNTGVGCHFLLQFSCIDSAILIHVHSLWYNQHKIVVICTDVSYNNLTLIWHVTYNICILNVDCLFSWDFPGALKNPPASAGDVQSLGWEDPLEEGMATHSNILAWRIPWTEDPGGLPSMGLKELDTTEVT